MGGESLHAAHLRVMNSGTEMNNAYVKIVEQPAKRSVRFRYVREDRSGPIQGASSRHDRKTFPSIKVEGYQGKAIVIVSCVTYDKPYRPHPHKLLSRPDSMTGVCRFEIPTQTMSIEFNNLGIQCVRRRDIEAALRVREELGIDPFRTGFHHKYQPNMIELNVIRLCFQVFIEGDRKGECTVPLKPVISQPVLNKKNSRDLGIVQLSECVSYADGGQKEIILLCEKISKKDVEIRFFEEKNNIVVWEGLGIFKPSQIHKQVAICFKPPQYHNLQITEPVKVYVQLRKPSDGETGEPVPFEYLPLAHRKRKMPKLDNLLKIEQELGINSNTYNWSTYPEMALPSTSTYESVQATTIGSCSKKTYNSSLTFGTIDKSTEKIYDWLSIPSTSIPPTLYDIALGSSVLGGPSKNLYETAQGSYVDFSQPMMEDMNTFGNSSLENTPSTSRKASEDLTWNIPYIPSEDSAQTEHSGGADPDEIYSFFDLNSKSIDLKQIHLSSGELSVFSGDLSVINLSDTINDLRLSDIQANDDLRMSAGLTGTNDFS